MTLERAGVPTATVVSDPFAFKARREVEALGYGTLPIIVLPHPIGQLPRDEMREIATASFEEVQFILTASPERVAAVYKNRTARGPIVEPPVAQPIAAR